MPFLGIRTRSNARSRRRWKLIRDICSLLWDYYEPTRYPWWLEDVYSYAARKAT